MASFVLNGGQYLADLSRTTYSFADKPQNNFRIGSFQTGKASVNFDPSLHERQVRLSALHEFGPFRRAQHRSWLEANASLGDTEPQLLGIPVRHRNRQRRNAKEPNIN